MVFKFEKYKCLHLSHDNPKLTYKMSNEEIDTTRGYLGGLFSSNLKVSEQCRIRALK